ncbi:MAG: IclR family transcriptional regulator [Deltaproteobacteria bacterium]|nr:IclR family transcriptional regulator [Deltaproteobacteria bacterium]
MNVNIDPDSRTKQDSHQRRGVQSIHRAVMLLRIVSEDSGQGLTLSNITKTIGLKLSTTHRILSSLVEEGLLGLNPETKCYRPGFLLFELGRSANQFMIRDIYRPALERIAKKTRDTAYLVIRDGYDSLCIDRVEGTAPLRLMLDVGARRPLGMGAASLSLFAFSSDKTVEKILRFNERRFREHSGMGIADMRKLIALCRQKGYTLTAGVVDRGVTGIGVPLYDRKNKIRGAISVAAISEKIDKTRYDDIAVLIKAEVDKTYHPPN